MLHSMADIAQIYILLMIVLGKFYNFKHSLTTPEVELSPPKALFRFDEISPQKNLGSFPSLRNHNNLPQLPFVASRLYCTFFLYLVAKSAAVFTDAFARNISFVDFRVS
jgi:hypothetical protein